MRKEKEEKQAVNEKNLGKLVFSAIIGGYHLIIFPSTNFLLKKEKQKH